MLRHVEDAVRLGWTVRRKSVESFMAPLTVLEDCLLCVDGSLVSLFRVEGARSITGRGELARFVEVASRRLNASLLSRGHALHVMFERDPGGAAAQIAAMADRQRAQAGLLGLDLEDLFRERSERLGGLLAGESCIVAVWTREAILPRAQRRKEVKARKKRLAEWFPRSHESQCPDRVLESLPPRHEAMVANMETVFGETGLVASLLPGGEAVRVLRQLVNGSETTADDWRPVGPEDRCAARETEPEELGLYPPALAPQLLVREPVVERGHVAFGGRVYGCLDMVLGPRRGRPFWELMERLADAGLPFRFSLFLEGGGLEGSSVVFSRVASEVLAVASQDSRHARDALRGLGEVRGGEQAVVRLRISMATWVGAGEGRDELARRLGRLQQVAEGWGECSFSPFVGDPLEAFLGTVPGFACGGTGEPVAAPLEAVLGMVPVSRPASPAREGADHLFRSEDGKPLGYGLEGSGLHGMDVVYGIPRRGKSVLMGSLSLAYVLQRGGRELPLLAIIDVGPTSSGLISLLREALPPDRRHEVVWAAPQMTAEYAINPCDTQLGCRYPLPSEKAFIGNLLALLLTRPGETGVPDGAAETIAPMIDEIYRMRADDRPGAQPHLYSAGGDGEVDAALRRRNVVLPDRPRWWDVVDELFRVGEIDAAARAQRFAVPTLKDCLEVVREPVVQSLVGEATYGPGGEPVTRAVIRILRALSSAWPVLFAPTGFDVGDARIVGIDLGALTEQGSAEADRQTAVMYLLARHALTRHWWVGEEELRDVPADYRGWHGVRLKEIRESRKRLVYDEFHRTSGAAGVQAQVDRDVREAGKQRVRVMVASQQHGDFGSLVRHANGYWVLGAGGHVQEANLLAELFELGEAALEAVKHRLTGPGRTGAPALHISVDERGRQEQVLVNSPGPVELWALSTSPRDVALRGRVQDRLGAVAGRAALARVFPGGSAEERVEAEMKAVGREAVEAEVLDGLAEEVVRIGRDMGRVEGVP